MHGVEGQVADRIICVAGWRRLSATRQSRVPHPRLYLLRLVPRWYTLLVRHDQIFSSIKFSRPPAVFVNHDANANSYDTVIQGSGNMSGFLFTFTNSKMEANQTAAGFFSFAGSPEQTGGALMKAGFDFHGLGENSNMQKYRSRGSFWTGANSAHFNVSPQADPAATVSTTRGDMHFGEHNPFSPFGWVPHTSEASQ